MACENKTVNKIVEVLNSKSAEDITVLNVVGLDNPYRLFCFGNGKERASDTGAL